MGGDAKRAKQARRDRRMRDTFRAGSSVTQHEVRTPDDLRDALSVMLPHPKAGDWRPDVIGVDKPSLQPATGRFSGRCRHKQVELQVSAFSEEGKRLKRLGLRIYELQRVCACA
jgi:hypothetical protein